MNPFKALIRGALGKFGYRLTTVTAAEPPLSPLVRRGVDLLFDVGANVGQYAGCARAEGYAGRIVSFEPLPETHRQLSLAAAGDPEWRVHARCALGATAGDCEINVSANSYSSSLLPLLPACTDAAPEAAYVATARTPMTTLDAVFGDYWRRGERAFLKIDTQGFERAVLDGAARSLSDICGVQLELSVKPLYRGQQTYLPLLSFLEAQGFELWELIPGFADPGGERLQFDAILFRPE